MSSRGRKHSSSGGPGGFVSSLFFRSSAPSALTCLLAVTTVTNGSCDTWVVTRKHHTLLTRQSSTKRLPTQVWYNQLISEWQIKRTQLRFYFAFATLRNGEEQTKNYTGNQRQADNTARGRACAHRAAAVIATAFFHLLSPLVSSVVATAPTRIANRPNNPS